MSPCPAATTWRSTAWRRVGESFCHRSWQAKPVTTQEYLGQAVFDVAVSPGRVAYLIRHGSRDGFRRAVQEACTRWGGQTEPIVPVPADGPVQGWWRQVVELARVEAIVNIDVPDVEATNVASILSLPMIPLSHIDAGLVASSFTAHPSAIENPPNHDQYLLAAPDAPLWQVTAAGDLADDHFAELTPPVRSLRQSWSFPIRRMRLENEIASAQLRGATLIDRTVAHFSEHWASGVPLGMPAVLWVTEADDLADSLWFWNLRALRPLRFTAVPMVLLPAGTVEYWTGYTKSFASTLVRPEGFSPDVIIGSHSADPWSLDQLAEHLGLRRSHEDARSGARFPAPMRQAPFTYLTWADLNEERMDFRQWLMFSRRYGNLTHVVAQLFRDSTVIRFPSPVPFVGEGFTLLRLSGGPLDRLPHRPSTAALVTENATWHGAALQLKTRVLRDYDVRLRIPQMADVVRVVLSEAVQQHKLSDKGKIGAALQASRDVGVLLQAGAYEAVVGLTTPRAARLRRELQRLHQEGAAFDQTLMDQLVAEWGHRGERRYRTAQKLNNTLAAAALETLVEQRWAERGFEIACTTCGIRTFVPMAHVPTRGPSICSGCQSPQRYTLQPDHAAPEVHYRLDALVDRASDQGVLPHLLVVAALTMQDPDCWLLPGTDVVFPGGEHVEVDIFGVHKARVLSGEVKTKAADFAGEQLTRDINLSDRLKADIHLLAAVDIVPAQTEAAARELCREKRLDLLVLSQPELRPTNPRQA